MIATLKLLNIILKFNLLKIKMGNFQKYPIQFNLIQHTIKNDLMLLHSQFDKSKTLVQLSLDNALTKCGHQF